jgi:hypothetical protein
MHELINRCMESGSMNRRIDACIAGSQFGQILDLATKNNERLLSTAAGSRRRDHERLGVYSRRGSAARLTAEAWTGAKKRGLDKLTRTDIEEETAAYRREEDPGTDRPPLPALLCGAEGCDPERKPGPAPTDLDGLPMGPVARAPDLSAYLIIVGFREIARHDRTVTSSLDADHAIIK